MRYILLISFIIFCGIAHAQTDTTACTMRLVNTKRCTVKAIRGYEVTTRKSEYDNLTHVSFLKENFKRIKPRKNRRVYFFESLM